MGCKALNRQPFFAVPWSLRGEGSWTLALPGLAACCLLLASVAGAAETPHVLVLYSNNRLLPANIEGERGLRETLASSVELSAEFLDYPRFEGEPYESSLTAFLGQKYARRPPAVIVAGGSDALGFLLEHRAQLFPGVPVVHMAVSPSRLATFGPLPGDLVGVTGEPDFSATIDQALRWHPRARRLVLVTGTAPPDRRFEAQLRALFPRFADRAVPEFLAGLPTAALHQRLAELGEDAVVFTPGYFRDGAGRELTPREAAAGIAAAANAPVYGPFGTFIGTGIVGGFMIDFEAVGRQAGVLVNALLAGAAPAALSLPEVMPATWMLDWRQVLRWGLDPDAIPAGTVIQFREPPFLEAHRREAMAAAAVFLLQSGLILWLLFERRRRRLAELAVQKQRFEPPMPCGLRWPAS